MKISFQFSGKDDSQFCPSKVGPVPPVIEWKHDLLAIVYIHSTYNRNRLSGVGKKTLHATDSGQFLSRSDSKLFSLTIETDAPVSISMAVMIPFNLMPMMSGLVVLLVM